MQQHEIQHIKRTAQQDLLDYILAEIAILQLDREGIIKLILRLRRQ